MGQERVEGYAEGFKVGWNKAEKNFVKLTEEIISRFGFDDQIENAVNFVKKRFVELGANE